MVEGHRARLAGRFRKAPSSLSEKEILELALTFAIPRRDVAPMADALLAQAGSLLDVMRLNQENIAAVPGLGDRACLLFGLFQELIARTRDMDPAEQQQPLWPEMESDTSVEKEKESPVRSVKMYAQDEIESTLSFLPQVADLDGYESLKELLRAELPYNSPSTRIRRASYILNRFFPDGRIDTPLAAFASLSRNQEDLKAAVFYELLKAEPLAEIVSQEVVWPSMPSGYARRDDIEHCIAKHLPELRPQSMTKALRSVTNTYDLLDVASQDKGRDLEIAMRDASQAGFLYVLSSEYPTPGMYSFDSLENGPMQRWLLWSRASIRKQMYELRERGIIAKISEIDDVRQFTTDLGQMDMIRRFFSE